MATCGKHDSLFGLGNILLKLPTAASPMRMPGGLKGTAVDRRNPASHLRDDPKKTFARERVCPYSGHLRCENAFQGGWWMKRCTARSGVQVFPELSLRPAPHP